MFHGGATYSTERAKGSTKMLNIPREGQMVHGGAKYSTERVKWSTEVPNIPRKMSNVLRRC